MERDDSESDMSEEDDAQDGDDDIPYNPKNLPLGWDGKPIPYWLYKLHGLNISYDCEICGNFTYKARSLGYAWTCIGCYCINSGYGVSCAVIFMSKARVL